MRHNLRRIDFVGRSAYGALCLAGATAVAAPLLLVAGVASGIAFMLDAEWASAAIFWGLAWVLAIVSAALTLGIFFVAWPLSSDWITEWPGYAIALLIGALIVLSLIGLVLLPVPIWLAISAPIVIGYAAGFAIAGKLAGLKAPSARPRMRVARRR